MLNKSDAEKIAKKLGAETHAGAAHDAAVIRYEGKIITRFGIRRGSRKDQGHGHIPRSIYLSMHDTRSLADCTFSYDDWIQCMKDKGVIPS
jgi:hypothetical protein